MKEVDYMSKCDYCGSAFKGDICPNCGAHAQEVTQSIQPGYQENKPRRRTHGCMIAFCIMIGIFAFMFFLVLISALVFTTESDTSVSSTKTEITSKSTKESIQVSENEEKDYISENEIPYIYTDTKKYKGKQVKLTGKVFLEPERDEDGIYFQMFQNVKDNDNNTIIVYLGESDVKDGDYVLIDGKVDDVLDGTNAFGGTVTAPRIIASSITISTYQEIVSPTEKSIESGEKQEQYGYEVLVDKIEFAKDETRVYITVNNNGDANFSAYPFNMKLIQGKNQYEEQDNWEAEYPKLQTDLYPGASTSGIVCFPSIKQSEDFTLFIEGYSDNWKEEIKEYKFDIKNK